MKIEIWSDVMCPFCYIGKRRLEQALRQFAHSDKLQVIWKSFLLNPSMETNPDKSINEYLAQTKGWTVEQARQMNDRVTLMAEKEGLQYNFDKAVVANSFDAHRLIQYARRQQKDETVEEALFRAYFTEGQNIADHQTLVHIARSVGLDPDEVQQVLQGEAYGDSVRQDIEQSRRLGIRGVPFFVINRRYGISGAQATEVFLDALNTAWDEQEQKKPEPRQ